MSMDGSARLIVLVSRSVVSLTLLIIIIFDCNITATKIHKLRFISILICVAYCELGFFSNSLFSVINIGTIMRCIKSAYNMFVFRYNFKSVLNEDILYYALFDCSI